MMKVGLSISGSISVLIVLTFLHLLGFSYGITDISKCFFYDKRNRHIKQTFYIPSKDVSMYRSTIEKMLSEEFTTLNEREESEKIEEENKKREKEKEKEKEKRKRKTEMESENENENETEAETEADVDAEKKEHITNMEDIKKKEEMRKRSEMKEKLMYLDKYRKFVKNVLKNIEFKCENVEDSETKIKCNLCVYTELINNKHIRQGQVIQIFMNECIYGFYYFDNIDQYFEKNSFKQIGDSKTNKKIDDVYSIITKDVMEGNTDHIIFFRQKTSVYHPVCYVSE